MGLDARGTNPVIRGVYVSAPPHHLPTSGEVGGARGQINHQWPMTSSIMPME